MKRTTLVALVLAFVACAIVCVGVSAQRPAGTFKAPRTAAGHPNLQGIWTNIDEMNVPFERPPEFGERQFVSGPELAKVLAARGKDREDTAHLLGGETGAGPVHWLEFWESKSARTSMVVDPPDGRIPPLTDAARKQAETESMRRPLRTPGVGGLGSDSWEDRFLWERCITRGVPGSIMPGIYNANYHILQSADHVVLLYEMIHDARVIPIDGRPHLPSSLRQWMGDSRGRWEGDTLVVDATNFSDKIIYRGSAETLHVVERFSLRDMNTLYYEATIDDPATWTRPWTFASYLKRLDASKPQIFEYACHEGNYGIKNILSAGRADERKRK
jgi:hypothetical protein